MRQAGRYLPEYRATRTRAGSFMDLCKNPELACEVTLQPLERYPLDAAILFSDILTVPDAMGLGLYFTEGEGPRFERPVRSAAQVRALPVPDPEQELGYVMEAVRTIRSALGGRVPLIGFSGSPWTLATYMVEGGSAKNFARCKRMMFDEPVLMHELLSRLADAVTAYLNAQVGAGAQALMLFDTWGGVLSPRDYREFSLAYRAPTRWAWTGPSRSARRAAAPAIASRCRATSTPACSTPRRSASARRSAGSWRATGTATATSSTSATASTPTSTPTAPPLSSRRCTS